MELNDQDILEMSGWREGKKFFLESNDCLGVDTKMRTI